MRITALLFLLATLWSPPKTTAQQTVTPDSLSVLLSGIYDDYYAYKFPEALKNSSLLTKKASETGNLYYEFRGYILLGQIHDDIKNRDKSRHYYEIALERALTSEQDSLISWAYNDLGNAYASDTLDVEKSIGYYQKAIEVNRRAGMDDDENMVQYMNIGWSYLDVQAYEKAYPYILKTRKLSQKEKQHPLFVLNLDILFGRYHYYAGNDNKAEEILTAAADAAEKQNFLDQAVTANQYAAALFTRQKKYELANAHLERKLASLEKFHEIQRESQVQQTSAMLEVEQYQKDLEVAKREQAYSAAISQKSEFIITILVISFIVLLIGLMVIYNLYKTRRKFIKSLKEKNQQLTEAKEQAEHLSNLKTQFFSTVSHELRTPLYGVVGLSSILMEDAELASHQDDLKSLKFSADYLLALINDVLTLNKMDANGIRLEQMPFNLDTLLKSIVKSFAFSLEQNNNTIHLEMDPKLPVQFLGDSVRLSQILMNIVGNAVKFNENGSIWIKINQKAQLDNHRYQVHFEVKDDGIGIPQDKQATIFEEFSQADNQNYNYQGTGLGLPIVKRLLGLFGSEIVLESELGKGTSFSFELPLQEHIIAETQEISALTADSALSDLSAIDNIHILVVDDNRINQKITQKILQTRNFNCSLANDGAEAVQMVRTHNYDLILMDIHMPRKNGIEATKEIRTFNETTPIIALTAVEVAEIRRNILAAGMNDIILKPYDVSQFLTTILRNLNMVTQLEES